MTLMILPKLIILLCTFLKLVFGIDSELKKPELRDRRHGVIASFLVFIVTHLLLLWGGWYDFLFK